MTVSEMVSIRDQFKEAYLATSAGKSYTISTGGTSRTVTKQDMKAMREEWQFWDKKVSDSQAGRSGIPVKFLTSQW